VPPGAIVVWIGAITWHRPVLRPHGRIVVAGRPVIRHDWLEHPEL